MSPDSTVGHGLTGVADAGVFLSRLVRLDPAALVRLRPAEASGQVELWARLPWTTLVTRTVTGTASADATVSAKELLDRLDRGDPEMPRRRDSQWRWPLPPSAGTVVERIPLAEVRRLVAAAAATLRTAASEGVAGRAVGSRMLRDALLDHVAVVVTPGEVDPVRPDGRAVEVPERIEIRQRLVQAVARMGFLGPVDSGGADAVQVRLARRWVGLSAPFGVAWLLTANNLSIVPGSIHPKV